MRKFPQTWFFWVLLAASIAPLLAALVNAAVSDWSPYGDFAVIEMRIRDVWSNATPLTGSWSRPGWNHPGPMMFWVLTPFSLLSGGSSRWVLIGGVVIAALFIGTALYLALRQSRALFVMTSLLWLMSLRALPTRVVFEYWNPWMVLPALILLVVLAIRASAGRTRDLIGLVVVGSFAVQTHVGTAPIVVAIGAFAFGCVALDAFRERVLPARFRSTAIWVVGLGALLWVAPLIGVVMRVSGNLVILGEYFLADRHASVGLPSALKIMANQFTPPFPWLGSGYKIDFLSGYALESHVAWLLLPIGALCLGGLLAYRQIPSLSGRRNDLRAIVLAILLFVASIIAISGADEPRFYAFGWRAIVAVFIVLACAMPIARAALARFDGTKVYFGGVVLVSGLALILASFPVSSQSHRLDDWTAELKQIDTVIESRSIARGASIRVEGIPLDVTDPSLIQPVIKLLERHGFEARVPQVEGRVYGSSRVARRSEVNEVWIVAENGSLVPGLLALPNAELVWSTTPLSRRDESRISVLQSKIWFGLSQAGKPELFNWVDSPLATWVLKYAPNISPADIQELEKLNLKVGQDCRCAIVKIPGGKGYLGGG